MAGLWNRWSGVRVGEARVPGPFDFDDPDAQPSVEEGSSGDDWQGADAASRAGGVENFVHEEYVSASCFNGAKQGFVFRCGGHGLGYYQDRKSEFACEKRAVLSQWPPYLKALGDMAPGWCKDLERAEQFKWTISLNDAIFGVGETGRTRRSRRRPKRCKRHRRKGQDLVHVPEFVDAEDDLHRKGARWWAFDTCNPNCSGAGVEYLGRSQADFCLVQEFREADPVAIQAKQRAAARAGWGLAVTPAVCTSKGGISAGVGIAARSAYGMTVHELGEIPECAEGRIAACHVGAVCKGGFHILSVYLWHSEGLSARNLDLLQTLAQVISRLRGPWLLAGDFNFTPQELVASGWLQLVRGRVSVPRAPTCGKKTLDFFVTSSSLAGLIAGVSVVHNARFHPHSPVRLWMMGKLRCKMVRQLVAPTKIPAVLPSSCAVDPTTQQALIAECPKDLEGKARLALNLVETELHDITRSVHVKEPRGGRAAGPVFKWKPALGRVGSHQLRISPVSVAWGVVASALKKMLIHWHVQQSGQGHLATVIKARATILCGSWKHLGEGTGARAFRWWIRNLDHRVLYSIHAVAQLNSTVSKIAEAARLYDAKQSTRSWLTWLHEGPAAGLGRQHQMSRVAGGWIPSRAAAVKGTDEARNDDPEHSWQNDLEDPSEEYVVHQANSANAVEVPLDKQQTVDLEADEWGSIWQAVKKQHQPAWPKEMGIQPPPLALPALKDVCSTFPADVGLGWDKLHPRALLRCSDCVLLLLIQVFLMAESVGTWFPQVGVVLVVLIPKHDGGRRPIGLFPGLVRIWMRARMPILQKWVQQHERPYFYGGPARGADVAAWRQAYLAELAKAKRQDYAASLLDLVKAFDTVPFHVLIEHGVALSYSLWILRLCILAYTLGRVLIIDGCCSVPIFATRGLAAGSITATIELRLFLIVFADRMVAAALHTRLTLYVDDATLETVGFGGALVDDHVRSVSAFAAGIIDVGMQFSDKKNVCTASRHAIASEITKRVSLVRIKCVRDVVSLGTAFAAGTRRTTMKAKARLRAFLCRRRRFKALSRAKVSAARVLRTGGTCALTYGNRPLGVSDSLLLAQRRAVAAAACINHCGADLNVSLVIADDWNGHSADPAFEAHAGVAIMWSLAIFEHWVDIEDARFLIASTLKRLAGKMTWARVFGPAAAIIVTLKRIGWTVHSATEWISDLGMPINLELLSPALVQSLVCEAVQRWRWKQVAVKLPALENPGGHAGAWIAPIRNVLARKDNDTWNHAHKGALKSAMANRQWTQQRLHKAGLSDSNLCQLCAGCEHGDQVGTHLHRFFCPVTQHQVRKLAPSWIRDMLDNFNGSLSPIEHCALVRGMIAPPVVPTRPDSDFGTFVWHVWQIIPAGCVVYTDGSSFDAKLGLGLEALGWAFAAFDADGTLIAAAFGVPPKDVNTIQGAELWALKQALTFVPSPGAIYVDCKTVVDGIRRGHRWIYSSKRRYHQHWVSIFQALDAGESAGKVVWVPAHISESRIGDVSCGDGTLLTEHMWRGNKLVDELAKRAAHTIKAPQDVVRNVVDRQVQAQELAVFVGQVTALANAWPGDDGGIRRDSTGKPQGTRRSFKKKRRVASVAGDGRSVGGVAVPVDAMLSRLDVTALSRPSPTPSPWVARARNLRDAAARAEAQNEASFSEWWRQSRDLRMAKASGAGSQRLSARERLDALRRRRSIPMRGA